MKTQKNCYDFSANFVCLFLIIFLLQLGPDFEPSPQIGEDGRGGEGEGAAGFGQRIRQGPTDYIPYPCTLKKNSTNI
jgi:hypothetical protein